MSVSSIEKTKGVTFLVLNYRTVSGHGCMRINMENAFPCDPGWLKKVLRIAGMCDNTEEIEAELLLHFNELFDTLQDPEEIRARGKSADYAAGLQKTEVMKIQAEEKALADYVKLHVKRGDKENSYRVKLEETREKLKKEKDRLRNMETKARDFKRSLEQRERDEKKIRECLRLLGQEVVDATAG